MGQAVTERVFFFRRSLAISPIIIPVLHLSTGSPVAIDKAKLQAEGVTCFKMVNPSPYWVWYRGWTGLQGQMPAIKEMGHYLAPGATDINTSQLPDWIAAVAQAELGVPAPASAQGVLTDASRIIMIYGSGNA